MMKLKFEVQPRPLSETRVALKPDEHCGLHGTLVYDLPQRAADQMKPGFVVEATISLPDQYPIEHGGPAERLPSKHPHRRDNAYIYPPWREIDKNTPLGERILLAAFDYGGPGQHAVAIGIGSPAAYPGALAQWVADLGNGEQNFTASHWAPLPQLARN